MRYKIPDELQNRTIITVQETCEILHITKNTLYELLRTQRIRAFKLNRKWMIPKSSVLDFIEKSII